jgi:hypothetical protein
LHLFRPYYSDNWLIRASGKRKRFIVFLRQYAISSVAVAENQRLRGCRERIRPGRRALIRPRIADMSELLACGDLPTKMEGERRCG